MKIQLLAGTLALVLITGFATPAFAVGPNLVVNGGFEEPDIPSGTFSLLANIPGWSVSSGPVIEVQDNVAGAPFEGDQFVELDSTGPTGIVQTVPTEAGKKYELSFAFSARPGTSIPNDNVLRVTWNGNEVFNDQAPDFTPNWTVFTMPVLATGDSTEITFEDVSPNSQNSFGVYIDDIQVVEVETFGEILTCNIALDPSQEVPSPIIDGFSPEGTAVIVVDTDTGDVSIAGNYSGMTSDVIAAHLHGLAPPGVAAGVIFGLDTDGGTSGSFNGMDTLSASNLMGLLDEQTYINVHTVNNGPGEIRGQVICPTSSAVGGQFLPTDSTALFLAGLSSSVIWIIPTLAGLAGAGVIIRTKLHRD